MQRKKASLVINPRTGENVAKLPDTLAVLSAAGIRTKIALKEYGKHVMKLAHAASEQKQDFIIAYGGDGTLNQVVNGVMSTKRHRGVVGIVPGGTANVWASEVGIPRDPVKAALALVDSDVHKVDVGRAQVYSITFPGEPEKLVNGEGKKKAVRESQQVRHHFLLMAGLGIDAAIMGNVSKPLKYRVGALAVGLSAAKELPAQHPFPIEIQAPGSSNGDELVWKGEALQVVIGNTRKYAKVAEMTPDAYIDDGMLDVCVITAGDPLTTLQQLSSLLLRLKPDNTTAEYFHGSRILIKVPATVPFQVDGSLVKLKDYLRASDYDKLQQVEDKAQVMVTYQIEALPRTLEVAIPRTYNDELFERTAPEQHTDEGISPVHVQPQYTHDDEQESPSQKHAVAVLSRSESEVEHKERDEQEQHHVEEMHEAVPEFAATLLEEGRKITVVGKAPNPHKKDTYIIAGTAQKQSTGEMMPVAVVVDGKTTVLDHEGRRIDNSMRIMHELLEGATLVVEGKRSKRNVIQAKRLMV